MLVKPRDAWGVFITLPPDINADPIELILCICPARAAFCCSSNCRLIKNMNYQKFDAFYNKNLLFFQFLFFSSFDRIFFVHFLSFCFVMCLVCVRQSSPLQRYWRKKLIKKIKLEFPCKKDIMRDFFFQIFLLIFF